MTRGPMDVVQGVEELHREHGRLFVVVGVFDGLHRGHAYLLDQLAVEARRRTARPTVITFDHHPDEVLEGVAPPLLLDPAERLERLAAAGVEVTVVQHFDATVRRIAYDDFVAMIASRVDLAGFLMTPDAAFGFERRGTPEALAALGRRDGFDVVVVPPFTLDGAPVRSSDIRAAIAAGDLARARELLGRDVTITGTPHADGDHVRLAFDMPVALPPAGSYAGSIDGRDVEVTIGLDGVVGVPLSASRDGGAPLRVTVRASRPAT